MKMWMRVIALSLIVIVARLTAWQQQSPDACAAWFAVLFLCVMLLMLEEELV